MTTGTGRLGLYATHVANSRFPLHLNGPMARSFFGSPPSPVYRSAGRGRAHAARAAAAAAARTPKSRMSAAQEGGGSIAAAAAAAAAAGDHCHLAEWGDQSAAAAARRRRCIQPEMD